MFTERLLACCLPLKAGEDERRLAGMVKRLGLDWLERDAGASSLAMEMFGSRLNLKINAGDELFIA